MKNNVNCDQKFERFSEQLKQTVMAIPTPSPGSFADQQQKCQDNQQFAKSVIIIGAGVFGLSTALAIADRHPSTAVTVIDRLPPPVLDGTSVDTTRCIRAGKFAVTLKQSMQEMRNYSMPLTSKA